MPPTSDGVFMETLPTVNKSIAFWTMLVKNTTVYLCVFGIAGTHVSYRAVRVYI